MYCYQNVGLAKILLLNISESAPWTQVPIVGYRQGLGTDRHAQKRSNREFSVVVISLVLLFSV